MTSYGLSLLFSLLYIHLASGLEVALFPSSGCYSHDVMMKQIGEELDDVATNNVTWIQTFLYDFGFGEIKLPDKWKRISIWGVEDEGQQLMSYAGGLLWEMNVPTDFDQLWDVRGTFAFYRMLERHQIYCEKMLENPKFKDYVKNVKVDVVVLDHFLQECVGSLSRMLNSSVVQFSNWPIADGYITSLNVPAMPSVVPKTGTPFSGLGMTFMNRVVNIIFHNIIVFTRIIQIYVLNSLFERSGHPEVRVIESEAERIIYAGRSEFLFEVVRPINNRVKHFGGSNCLDPKNYVVHLPDSMSLDNKHVDLTDERDRLSNIIHSYNLNNSLDINSTEENCIPTTTLTASPFKSMWMHREKMYESTSADEVTQRFEKVSKNFPNINWEKINSNPFILVSFGSVAKVSLMPIKLLKMLIKTFTSNSRTVIWQTNSDVEKMMENHNITKPDNLIIINWAPIKELLAHPNLMYIICHGGINTINELLLFGVPVIGVPLQGDQGSNLKRLVDLGAAEMVPTYQMAQGKLATTISKVEKNLDKYWKRSTQLASMLQFYRQLHSNDQQFWLRWTARNGRKLQNRNLLKMRYTGDEENAFWALTTLGFITSALLISF